MEKIQPNLKSHLEDHMQKSIHTYATWYPSIWVQQLIMLFSTLSCVPVISAMQQMFHYDDLHHLSADRVSDDCFVFAPRPLFRPSWETPTVNNWKRISCWSTPPSMLFVDKISSLLLMMSKYAIDCEQKARHYCWACTKRIMPSSLTSNSLATQTNIYDTLPTRLSTSSRTSWKIVECSSRIDAW